MISSTGFIVGLRIASITLFIGALSNPALGTDSSGYDPERAELQDYEVKLRIAAEKSEKQAKRNRWEQKQAEQKAAREKARQQKESRREDKKRKNAIRILIQRDKQRVDAVLRPLLKVLALHKGGFARIKEVGGLLQKINDNHVETMLESHIRRHNLESFKAEAHQLYHDFSNSTVRERYIESDPTRLEAELNKLEQSEMGRTVRDFILSYFLNVKKFKSASLGIGLGAIGAGLNASLGLGTVSHLSGRKQLVFCPELGAHDSTSPVTGTVSCAYSKVISKSNVTYHQRMYEAMVLGPVQNFEKDTYSIWKDEREPIGACLGFGAQRSYSYCLNIPIFPFFKDYGFVRKELGIHYEGFLNDKSPFP